jgi:thioredoxin reductase (NADPH)
MADASRHDALVIGGGPGGLTGALCLARFRRKVLVIDAGDGRAERIPRAHNVPGFVEGVEGRALTAAMRAQALRYGAQLAAARVERLELTADGFVAHWDGGTASAPLALLASGVSDIEPALPHLAEAVRAGALRYCPVCDGYEVIGRSVGLIADRPGDLAEAIYLRHFSDRVSLFVTSHELRFSEAEQQRIAEAGIALVAEPVRRIRLEGEHVAVTHGAATTRCDALYAALGLAVHSELALGLGALHDDDGCLIVDAHHRTSIEGLYAAGDVAKGLNQIVVAAGGAAIAASAMHMKLLVTSGSDPRAKTPDAGSSPA